MSEIASKEGSLQTVDATRSIRRKRINEVSRIALRVIPEEFAACGDIRRIADDWGINPGDVRDVVLAHLARELAAMKRERSQQVRVVSIDRRAA